MKSTIMRKFLSSFKPKKEHGIAIVLDLVFYAIMIPLAICYITWLGKKAAILSLLMEMETTTSVEQMQPAMTSLSSFFMFLIWGAVILVIVALFAYSLSRTLIWNYLLKKKFELKKYLKFDLLNLILFIAAAVILIACALLLWVNPIVAVILIFLALAIIIFFVMLAKMEYTKSGKIFAAIGSAFSRIDSKTALAWLLYVPVFAVFGFAINKVVGLLPNKITGWVIALIIFAVFLAWARLYITKVISH